MELQNFLLIIIFDISLLEIKKVSTIEDPSDSSAHLSINGNNNGNTIPDVQKIIDADNDTYKGISNQTSQKITNYQTTVSQNVPPETTTLQVTITTTTESCYFVKEERSGHISSPGGQYKDTIVQCYWMVIVPHNHIVRLKFTTFELPSMSNDRCMDGFLLYGSYDEQNQQIDGNQFCGKQIPVDYYSHGNKCWLYFQALHHTTSARFELIFDAVPVVKQSGSKLSLLALLLLIIIPVLITIFICYIKKRRREEAKKTEAEIFERFKKKHMRSRTLLMAKRNNALDRDNNNIQIRVDKASNDHDTDTKKKYFETDISSIRASGEYGNMIPGQFYVRRVLMPSGISNDGSVFLHDTPDEMKTNHNNSGLNYSNNFLALPSKFSRMDPIPSYMSFRQPYSISSIDNSLEFDRNFQQTTATMGTNSQKQNGSIDSVDSMAEPPPYKDPPSYQSPEFDCNNYNDLSTRLPAMISDTSVFSHKHPMTLDRKKKRRKNYLSTSLLNSGSSKKSKYYSMTVNDVKKLSYKSARSHYSSGSKEDSYSYRPGTGHTKFLSTSSVTDGSKFIPSSNLQKGKWNNVSRLNDSEYRLSSDNCTSLQNLTEMKEMCKTMPIIHVSSFSSVVKEHNTLSYSAHPINNLTSEPESNSTSNNENMSLINEEDTSGTHKEFDNPAFEMDESPLQDNKNSQNRQIYSTDENQSFVDINNNTQINDNEKENKSFVVNEFCPGENNVIVLSIGETMV